MENNSKKEKNINQIRAILAREIHMVDEQINYVLLTMRDIDKITAYDFSNVISTLKNAYNLKDTQIVTLLNSNPPAELFNLDNLMSKMKLFQRTLETTACNYKFAVLNNPHAFAKTDDELEAFIFEAKRDLGMDNTFMRNLLTRTGDFARDIENYIPLAKAKLDYLYAMGFTPEQISAKPGLLSGSLNSISTRLIYAYCNEIPMEQYLEESLFISTEEKIHARTMACRSGLFKKDLIYEPESLFASMSGYKTSELKKVFPFTTHAKADLLREFGEKYPELSAISVEEYKKANDQITAHINSIKRNKVTRDNTENTEEQSLVSNELIIDALKTSLGVENLNKNRQAIVLNNIEMLQSMGFSKEELLANPSALTLSSDRLMWRVKLARINGRTNEEFLGNDYRHDEMVIFPRTCGVKIMNTRTKATARHIYNSELVFARTFGTSTSRLSASCKLNAQGRKLVQKLYLEAINPEENQDEKE